MKEYFDYQFEIIHFYWLRGFLIKTNRNEDPTWLNSIWSRLSKYPYINSTIYLENPSYPWDIFYMFTNDNLHMNIEDIISYIGEDEIANLVKTKILRTKHYHRWKYFCGLSKVKLSIIRKYKKLPWCFEGLSSNPNIDIEFIRENIDKNWFWVVLSLHRNITIEFVLENLDKRWGWSYLTSNPSIKLDDIISNKHLPWDYGNCGILDRNGEVDMNFVKQHPDLPWDYDTLPAMLDLEDIENHSDINWNYEYISNNQNISFDFFKRNINKFLYPKDLVTFAVFSLVGDTKEIFDYFIENESLVKYVNILLMNPIHKIEDIMIYKNHINLHLLSAKNDFNPSILEELEDITDSIRFDWETITKNKNFSIEYIKKNQKYHWSKLSINQNPNITFKQIENEEESKKLGIILPYLYEYKNDFEYEKKKIIENYIIQKMNVHHELIHRLGSPDIYFHLS